MSYGTRIPSGLVDYLEIYRLEAQGRIQYTGTLEGIEKFKQGKRWNELEWVYTKNERGHNIRPLICKRAPTTWRIVKVEYTVIEESK